LVNTGFLVNFFQKKPKNNNILFLWKNPKITILFWVLVLGFMNLVSVDAKERSLGNLDIFSCTPLALH
jgi:hypothetical protein